MKWSEIVIAGPPADIVFEPICRPLIASAVYFEDPNVRTALGVESGGVGLLAGGAVLVVDLLARGAVSVVAVKLAVAVGNCGVEIGAAAGGDDWEFFVDVGPESASIGSKALGGSKEPRKYISQFFQSESRFRIS